MSETPDVQSTPLEVAPPADGSPDLLDTADLDRLQDLLAGTGVHLALLDSAGQVVVSPSSRGRLADLCLNAVTGLSAFREVAASVAPEGDPRVHRVCLGPIGVWIAPLRVESLPPRFLAGALSGVAGPLGDAEIRALVEHLGVETAVLRQCLAGAQPSAASVDDAVVERVVASAARLLHVQLQERVRARARNAELTALTSVSASVGASLDPNVVLGRVLDHALELLGCRQGSIMLLEDDGDALRIAVGRGLDEELMRTVRVALGEGIAGYVAQTGEPKNLRKGVKDRYSQRDDAAEDAKAALCVPLFARSEVLGVLNVSDRAENGDFADSDVALLQGLAAQAAAAIANAELYDASVTQNRQLVALTEVSAQLGSSLDPGEVLARVLDHALSLLNCRQGSIMLLDEGHTELSIAAGRGLEAGIIDEVRVPMGSGIAGYVAQTGEPKNLRKGVKDRYSQTDDPAREATAALCVPLRARNEVIGVLNVSDRPDGQDFQDTDAELLESLATQAAAAIANATLYDASEQRNEQLSALFSLGVEVSEAIDVDRDRVLQAVLDRATELSRARKGSLMLIDEEDEGRLRIVAGAGLGREIIETVRPRLGEGIAGGVAGRGEPLVLQRGQRDERSRSQTDADSAVCLPLRVGGEVIGVLNVSDKEGGEDFTEEDVQLLTHLGQQAAIAIEKATLYSEMHEMFMGTVRALANAIDARDPYTERHSERVAEFACLIANRLRLDEEEVEDIRVAGLLHDVGKIGIREAILGKPGRLDDDEYQEMQSHPVKGERILQPVQVSRFRRMLPWMKYHHEQYSAAGYPDGLHGEDIPLPARIIAVCDTYDAMTSDRPYRKGLPHELAVQELQKCAGQQFDPKVVQAFLDCDTDGLIAPVREIK